jgi:heme-degrading monooxygenase HmoA
MTMSGFHVAQLNVGRSVAPLDDPVMAGFMNRLADINALGERSPGFVWRLQGETGNATTIHAYDDPRMIVNLTVWESIEHLYAFAYHSQHMEVFRRRHEWFERLKGPSLVLWWLPAGELPTVVEARRRLDVLDANGPTSEAFTFKTRFDPPRAMTLPVEAVSARVPPGGP